MIPVKDSFLRPTELEHVKLPENIPAQVLYDLLKVMNLYKAALRNVCSRLEFLDDEFQLLYDHNPIHHMESRIKSFLSISGKVKRRGFEPTYENICKNITDIAGVRVICPYIDDVYKLAELITQYDGYRLIKRNDYIKNPKDNGYRSLHIVISVPFEVDGEEKRIPVEIQLRSLAMDMWASLEHEMVYKSEKGTADIDKLKLKICADDLAKIDEYMQEIYKNLD